MVFNFVADEVTIKGRLEDAGLLLPNEWDDPALVAAALTTFLNTAIKEKLL